MAYVVASQRASRIVSCNSGGCESFRHNFTAAPLKATSKAHPPPQAVRREPWAVVQHAWDGASQVGKGALVAAGAAGLMLSAVPSAMASEKVAEFAASGIVFKDKVDVVSLPDEKVEGVTIYISDFQRSVTDRLSKDFFSQPSNASVTCALTGKLAFNEADIGGSEGQEVFSERKGLNLFQNKTLRVRRIYDAEKKTLLYVAYTTHLAEGHDDAGRYKTSVCAIPLAGNSSVVPNAS
mmetsp:Transcript_6016/g.17229  ORF Transcript_6016/g.17229 Transcript_6016/m.17229 type:complete len:237 (+) Transcript_6016:143-853(+)